MEFDFFNSNLQIPYPFLNRDTVARGAAASADISGLFVSLTARLADRDADRLGLLSMHVLSSTTFPTIQSAVAVLKWVDDGTTIDLDDSDSDTTFAWNAYGDWAVFSWTKEETISIQFAIPITAITTNGGNEEFVVGYDGGYTPQTADIYEFQQSRVLGGPGRVRRVYVKQGSNLTLVAENGSDVLIQPGFNMDIAPADSETAGRQLTRVAIDAIPGAGRGRYLLCPGRQYLYTINGVGADTHGGAALAPEECYWVELPVESGPTPITEEHGLTEEATLLPNSLRLHNSCLPCCSCDDYIAAYDNMRTIWNRAKAVSLLYQQLRTGYNQLLAQYEVALGTADTLTLAQYDEETIRVIAAYNHTAEDTELSFEFDFDLPTGVTLSYIGNAGVFLSSSTGGPQLLDPNTGTENSTPLVEVTGNFYPDVRSYWTGLWKLVDITAGQTVTVSVEINDGETQARARDLEFE